ncbi:transposase [Streptomyces sp. enrichment culture]|uniref:transposase n=1 Tax=Streptomyces sp. enrichment culture TaxID=1795815 RepID=UPI003F56B8CE
MRPGEAERLRGEFSESVADVFVPVPRRDQRRWGECHLRGADAGRPAEVGPAGGAGRLPDGDMQVLQQFVNQSPWDPPPVRRRIAERLSGVTTPEVWVIDDVSFPGCGKAPVVAADAGAGQPRSVRLLAHGATRRGRPHVQSVTALRYRCRDHRGLRSRARVGRDPAGGAAAAHGGAGCAPARHARALPGRRPAMRPVDAAARGRRGDGWVAVGQLSTSDPLTAFSGAQMVVAHSE